MSRFVQFAWALLVYTIGVVLFGAVVRITGSGAGCGQHWPTCQGDILAIPRGVKMAIEYSHRATSGLNLLAVIALVVLARRHFPKLHTVRKAATASLVLIVFEAFIGAVLVRRALVAGNASVERAIVMPLHLVNTYLLTGALALTAWTATHASPKRWLPQCGLDWALLGALAGAVIASISGAVTALGDTLYPVVTTQGLAERIATDQAASASFFERGRAVHPLVALVVAGALLVIFHRTRAIRPYPGVERAARTAMLLVFVQVGAGAVNIMLSAPAYMQVIHLGIATVLWLSLVLLYATAMAEKRSDASSG